MDNFWQGFEKQAFLKSIVKGVRGAGKSVAGWGKSLSERPDAGWFSKTLGSGLQNTGSWVRKNPIKTTMIGTGVAGLGTGMALGSRGNEQNVNVYK